MFPDELRTPKDTRFPVVSREKLKITDEEQFKVRMVWGPVYDILMH
jgi:hypothetical protein